MKKWIPWVGLLIAAAGLTVGGFWWMQRDQAATADATTGFVQNITVQRGDITARISAIGDVYAPQAASLSFEVTNVPIVELLVEAGQSVQEGDLLARVDPEPLKRDLAQAEADFLAAEEDLNELLEEASDLEVEEARLAVAQAEIALQQALQSKEDLLNPDLEAAERAVREARYNLDIARLNLELTKISTTVAKNVRDLEYTVAWYERKVRDLSDGESASGNTASVTAQQNPPPGGRTRSAPEPMTLEEAQEGLAEAQEQLELAKSQAASTLASAEVRVAQAEAALADAQETLAELRTGPDAADLAKADAAIAQAEYRLAQAQGDLADLLAGPDSRAVQRAQARYDAAQAAYEEAQAALDGAAMTAPFDGTVLTVNAEVGMEVSSSDVILTLANLENLRVQAYIDETEITQVEVGQEVQITFDAFPGWNFQGTVLEVPIEGELQGNVVVYEVPISLEAAEGVSLKPGMTANIEIETGSRQDVLLVPAYAVMQTSEGWAVMVQDASGATVATPVQIGLSDGTYVEIVRGLNEGDTVMAQLQEEQQQRFGPGGGLGGLGRMLR